MSSSERTSIASRTIINMLVLNEQRTRNINYSNYIINIPFKLVDGSIKHHYAIEKNAPLPVVVKNLTREVRQDFGFEHFDIIPFNLRYETGDEINKCLSCMYSNINEVVAHQYLSKTSSFYIRPILDFANNIMPIAISHSQMIEINDCPVCFGEISSTRMNRYFNCDHPLCINCFNQWRTRRGNDINCPLCRSECLSHN
ncbi:MAG: RING finger domain-containing protein [Candidatus Paceibacterota bacterium]